MQRSMTRRAWLAGAAACAGTLQAFAASAAEEQLTEQAAPSAAGTLKVSIFSKHLHFLDVQDAALAAKDMGFDGIDLTVRPDGHVLPENVARDLPRAVELIHKAGLTIPMITTEITPYALPQAEAILSAAAKLGIRKYRWGGLKYKPSQSIPSQLEALRPGVRALAELNKRTGTCGMYHTHSGPGLIGATVWDVYELFRDLDTQAIGVNYDIGHATVEGGYGGWIATSKLTGGMMHGIAIKDFLWGRDEAVPSHPVEKSSGSVGEWVPQWCPIDRGMVRFDSFFAIVKQNGFDGPLQLHIEYPLGGAENGKRSLTLPHRKVLDSIHADLLAVRAHLSRQGLA